MGVTLFQRSGVYWLNVSHNGQRKRRSLDTRDKRVANRIQREVESRIILGQYNVQPARKSYSQFLAEYIGHSEIHKRPRTVDNDRRFLRILDEEIHPVVLTDVTPEQVEVLKKRCAKRGHSPSTINMMIRHLSAAFNHAVKQGHLLENPFKGTKRVRVDQKPPQFLTDKQIVTVLKVAKNHGEQIHLVFALGIYAGLRHIEIVNARWEWFDFKRDLITVTGRGDFQLKGRRFRTLPLHVELKRILKPHRKNSGYVFSPEREKHRGHYRYEFKRSFNTGCALAKLSWVTPHILRHTFASQLAIAGVSLFKISQWLGHRNITTTMIYSHLQAQDDDINRLPGPDGNGAENRNRRRNRRSSAG